MASKLSPQVSNGRGGRNKSTTTANSWLSTAARSFRLQLLLQSTRWRSPSERKKVAQYRNRWIALLHLLSHLIPLTATLTFMILNLRTTFVGHVSTTALTALQFAAKLLEVLVQASVAAIVMSIVRAQLLASKPFPFGALMAPYRTMDVSYLWSLDMWGSMTSTYVHGGCRVIIILLLPAAVLLAALVGPSSAVLLIPRPMLHDATRVLTILNTSSALYPPEIDTYNDMFPLDPEVESTVGQGSYGIGPSCENTCTAPIVDHSGVRTLQALVAETYDGWGFTGRSTVPTRLSTAALSSAGTNAVTQVRQPIVELDCWYDMAFRVSNSTSDFINFGPAKEYLNKVVPYANALLNSTEGYGHKGVEYDDIREDGSPWQLYLSCHDMPTSIENDTALMILAGEMVDAAVACTIDAYWVTVRTNTTSAATANDEDLTTVMSTSTIKELIRTKIADWLSQVVFKGYDSRAIVPDDDGITKTIFAILASVPIALSVVPAPIDHMRYWPFNATYATPRSYTDLTQKQYSSLLTYFSQQGYYHKYDEIRLYDGVTNWTDPASLSQVPIQVLSQGYGYNTDTITVRLSLIVIATYICTCSAYLLYTLITGTTATSWDSVAELVTLAFNSRRPESLQGTSVGLETLETFRQPVNVRLNNENSLEIVFGNDKEHLLDRYTKVVVNEKY